MKAFLPKRTRLSQVHLRTACLERSLAFYTTLLGLHAIPDLGSQARLTSGPETSPLLVLTEKSDAPSRPARCSGLHHFALRYPSRSQLASVYRRLNDSHYPIIGACDDGVCEAIHLSDPDGNGVELCADRPRARWPWQNGRLANVFKALDPETCFYRVKSESAGEAPPVPLGVGHIHFHLADFISAERFYREFLGLDAAPRSCPGALFFAAGGYHHHIGVEVQPDEPAPSEDSVGLVSYRIEVPVNEILYCLGHRAPLLGYDTRSAVGEGGRPILQIREPSGSWLEVQASPAAEIREPCGLSGRS